MMSSRNFPTKKSGKIGLVTWKLIANLKSVMSSIFSSISNSLSCSFFRMAASLKSNKSDASLTFDCVTRDYVEYRVLEWGVSQVVLFVQVRSFLDD